MSARRRRLVGKKPGAQNSSYEDFDGESEGTQGNATENQKHHYVEDVFLYSVLKKKCKQNDKMFRKRDLLELANVVISIIFMIILLQTEWNGENYHPIASTCPLKLVLFLLTCLNVLQICEYYYRQVQVAFDPHMDDLKYNKDKMKTTLYTPKSAAKQEMSEKSRLIVQDEEAAKPHTPHLPKKRMWVKIRSSDLFNKFLLEVAVTAIHPFPWGNVPSIVGLLMFFRLYVAFKVIRDFSPIYKKRRDLQYYGGITGSPSFNTFLTFKVLFHQKPLVFMASWILCSSLILSYMLHVLERDVQPQFTFPISLFIIAQSMITGWANDTYNQYNIKNMGSKFVCIFSVLVGLFLFVLLIDFLNSQMLLSNWQETAMLTLKRIDIFDQERNEAARLIQRAYRLHRMKKMNAKNHIKLEDLQENFDIIYATSLRKIRMIRRAKQRHEQYMATLPYNQNKESRDSDDEKSMQQQEEIKKYIDRAVADMKLSIKEEIARVIKEINLK